MCLEVTRLAEALLTLERLSLDSLGFRDDLLVAALIVLQLHLGVFALSADERELRRQLMVSARDCEELDLLGHLGQRGTQAHELNIDILQSKQCLWLRHMDSFGQKVKGL